MTYLIQKTNGEDLVEILDSSIDTTATDLTLIGKNVTGYGEFINENFVKLLENFASTSEPSNPIVGQLWFDLSEDRIKVYDGNGFTVASGPLVSPTAPLTPNQGDIWIDNLENQVYAYDGIDRILMGPIYKDSQGISGFEIVTIKDNFGNNKTVSLLWNNANLIGIWSHHTEFTPVGISNYTGTIKPGFNVTDSNYKFNGLSEAAGAILDDEGNYKTVNDFFLNDVPNTTLGTITILNPSPLILGANQETTLTVSTNLFELKNNINNQDFFITTRTSSAYSKAVTIKAATKRVGIFNETPSATLHIGTTSAPGNVIIDGNLTVNGTTTTINSTDLSVDDKTITLASTDLPSDITADGGGIILAGTTNHTLLWSNLNDSWDSSEHFNIALGKSYRINNVDVLSQTTLSPTVTSALGLTQLGTLTSLQVDNININGLTITASGILNLVGTAVNVNDRNIVNVLAPSNPKDATNKKYVDDNIEPPWQTIEVDVNVPNRSRNLIRTIAGPIAIGLPRQPQDGHYVRFADYDGTFDINSFTIARYRNPIISSPNGVAIATVPTTYDDVDAFGRSLGLATTGGSGTGLTVKVDVSQSGTYTNINTTITPVRQGSGYQTGDVIVVSGTLLGGTSPANDLEFSLSIPDNILGQTDDLVVTTKNAAFGLVYSSPSQGWTYMETLQFPPTVVADLVGNVTGNVVGNVIGNVTGDVTGDVTGQVLSSTQPYITSLGTLGNLDVTGTVTAASFSGDLTGNVTGTLFGSVTGSSVNSTTALLLMSNLGDIKLRSGNGGVRISAFDDTGSQEQYNLQITPGTASGNRSKTLLFGDVVVENISSTNINGSSFRLPQYTTVQRDARSYNSLNYGELLYNTTTNKVQAYTSTGWVDLH